MNTHDSPTDQARFPKLLYAPLGLLIVALTMRGIASPLAVVAVDLLALSLACLAGWLGGEFVASREEPLVHRARPRVRRPLRHKSALN